MIKKNIDKEVRKVESVKYVFNCAARHENYSIPVNMTGVDMSGETCNQDIVTTMKEKVRSELLKQVKPEEFDAEISAMLYDTEAKAWAFCALWMELGTKEWGDVYRKWEPLYDPNYEDVGQRNAILEAVGCSNAWIAKKANKVFLRKRIVAGAEPVGGE